jgi:hypothetical protein
MERHQHLWGIVLAAGSGERRHPFLRRGGHRHPIKQFCAVTGRYSPCARRKPQGRRDCKIQEE